MSFYFCIVFVIFGLCFVVIKRKVAVGLEGFLVNSIIVLGVFLCEN